MKGVYQKEYKEQEDSFFQDENSNWNDFWINLNELDRSEEEQMIFSGRLWQKIGKNKKWKSFHFELYSDKLLRIDFQWKKDQQSKLKDDPLKRKENDPQISNLNPMNPQIVHTINVSLPHTTNLPLPHPHPHPQTTNSQLLQLTNPSIHQPTSPSIHQLTNSQVTQLTNSQVPQPTNTQAPQPVCTNNQTNQSINDEDNIIIQYTPINQCFLKKIKYSDNSFSNYKYGIRLQRGSYKTELFTESADTFNKWNDEIKRYCILGKCDKKYKVLMKYKVQTLLPNSTTFFKCFRFSDSSSYSMRMIDKNSLSDANKQQLLKEIQIMRKIDHPFLCRLYEIYEDDINLYLITELFQGYDMKIKLTESLILDERTISEIMWKLLQGLHHMHQRNIFHRDIKLENIQFRSPQNLTDICLTNFSMADFIEGKGQSSYKKCGTPGFMAPEIFKSKHYDQKVDIFSLGVIFYILLYGKMPFDSPQVDKILLLNEQCEINFAQEECVVKCTSSAIDLLTKMLQKDPNVRQNAFELMNHAWFVNMKNRGDNGRMRNNYLGMTTLSTILEQSSDIIDSNSKQDAFNYRAENGLMSKVQEENNFGLETLNQKMTNLNSNVFTKVPSKFRHDMNKPETRTDVISLNNHEALNFQEQAQLL